VNIISLVPAVEVLKGEDVGLVPYELSAIDTSLVMDAKIASIALTSVSRVFCSAAVHVSPVWILVGSGIL
jgi:hypothetical protein